ncbi:3-hydroxyacyl-CoA dehydrogenase NAD-binding domain-containing protein [Lysobacter sp. CA199]|uniref:3-hydroxyacyl-CoA dehydrogenase NAD-binding domain-containing protein n=1 Tax=Lysobacter sp. CA199 TaxID=3455608 RepID=UPI003F8D3F33
MSVVTICVDGDIAVVTIDHPPVNALSQPVREGLLKAAAELDAAEDVKAVVLHCAGRTFIAGADVAEFGKAPMEPHLPQVVNRIEAASKPWTAAIHGTALGGGFEIALGCRFRIASPTASVGLPEVGLGLVPGASGTVRTPRLVGAEAALELVTTGKPVKAAKALDMGLLDAVVEGDLLAAAKAFARQAMARQAPLPVSQRPVAAPPPAFWDERKAAIAKRAKGETAPLIALECVRKAVEAPFAEALAFERKSFLELRGSPQAAALRTVFFAERAAAHPAGMRNIEFAPLRKIGVVGGGTMGAGIAAALRDADLPVVMIERDDEAVARGLGNIRSIVEGGVKRGKLTPAQAEARLAGVTASTDYGLLADADMVIEAVFEELSVKRAVFERLTAACRGDAVLATNTSYLDPRLIAQDVHDPSRFIGLHFFSPANVMKLLEIVPIPQTSAQVLASSFALARTLGKVPIQSGICEGFIGNRILKRYRAAAESLVRDGVPIAQIDAAMREYGFAMGPFEAQDLGGLDIAYLQREGARASGQSIAETLGDILVRAGRKGHKTRAGWYDYTLGDRTPQSSAIVSELLGARIGGRNLMARSAIADRLVGEMADEGDAILAEGIAGQASDIDLVEIHGYGFPRWRGGPMFARASGGPAD